MSRGVAVEAAGATDTIEVPDAAVAPGAGSRRRVGLVTVDQALSSASNLLAILAVAHVLTPIDFGRFSILFLVYAVAQSLARSVISVSAMVHPEDADGRPGAVLGATVLVGGIAGLICLAAAGAMALTGSVMAPATVVLGVCLAPLLLQDVGRYLAFARARPQQAIVLDTLWVLLMVLGFVVAGRFGSWSLTGLVIVWAGAGAVAAFWVFAQYGVPSPRDVSLRWLRERWDFAWRNLVGDFTAQFVGLFGVMIAAAVSSATTVAALRGSLLLGRPSAAIQLGVVTSSAADVAREKPDDAGLRGHQRRAVTICVTASALNLAALLVIPDQLGRAILGDVWPLMKPLLVPVGLFSIAASLQIGIGAVLVGRREMRIVMPASVVTAMIGIPCMTVGAGLDGATGAIWGTVIGQSVATAIWWVLYLRYLRARRRPSGRHRPAPRRAGAFPRDTVVDG